MQARLATEQFITQSIERYRRIQSYFPHYFCGDVLETFSKILEAQMAYFKEVKKIIPLYAFLNSYGEIHKFLTRLDDDFIDWESAIKDNAANKVGDILKVTGPIVDRMGANFDAVVEKFKEHVSDKAYQLPTFELSGTLLALTQKSFEIDELIKKLPIPNEEFYDMYHKIKAMIIIRQADFKVRLEKDGAWVIKIHKNKMDFINIEDELRTILKKYQAIVNLITENYNELTDMAEDSEVSFAENEEATQIKALREERKTQAERLTSWNDPTQTSSNDGVLVDQMEQEVKAKNTSTTATASAPQLQPTQTAVKQQKHPATSAKEVKQPSAAATASASASVSQAPVRVHVAAEPPKGLLGKFGINAQQTPVVNKSTVIAQQQRSGLTVR